MKYPNRKMGSFLHRLTVLSCVLFVLPAASALPLCIDSRAPVTLKSPLSFCPYNGSSCCDAAADTALQKQFSSMNISDAACASVVKSIICAKCDPFSADLFRVESTTRTIPLLCNSTLSMGAAQAKGSTMDFCEQVWDTCKDVSISNSPFVRSSQGTSGSPASSKFSNLWQSKSDFCKDFGGSPINESVCFDGKSILASGTQVPPTPKGLCLERIGNGSYLNMAAHPDGSNRVFLSNQEGKIWLATIPEEGSGGLLDLDESNPFLDISDEVHHGSEFGLMGIAFHPDFTSNGRFFVSYNCDKSQGPSCSGRCSCNSEVGCDPTTLGTDNGAMPCQYHSVIAEFSANGSSTPSAVTSAIPVEIRRIFTMGLPFTSHHAGQILFGPADGYLYFMMGDGGSTADPLNFAQNKKSLLGKIMRFDVDNMPSVKQINDLGLWGNYSIPRDNPYINDNKLRPEIWALGFRNPWRCSFDLERPSYFFCADVGKDLYEEVDLISKGGNYGWRAYEGPFVSNASAPDGNTTLSTIFPVMGYNHSIIDISAKSASITGGYVYRSQTDPCMFGRYLYADLYGKFMWVGTEDPKNSGNYSSMLVPFTCARDTPIACEYLPGSTDPGLQAIFSFGEDNKRDVYVLANTGVYRVVRPSRCGGYTCPIETASPVGRPPSSPSSSFFWSPDKSILAALLLLIAASLSS